MTTPDDYKKYFEEISVKIRRKRSANFIIKYANEHWERDDIDTRYRVAYSYFAAADFLCETSKDQLDRASRLYHYAGHHFRFLEEWNKAGKAYRKAGDIATKSAKKAKTEKKAKEEQEWAIRSYARAKNCYADVGDAEDSALAYKDEQKQRLRLAEMTHDWKQVFRLKFWEITSDYGESLRRWFCWVIVIIFIFTYLYELEHCKNLFNLTNTEWKPLLTGIYFSFVTLTTFGAGDIHPAHSISLLTVIANIVIGYVFLGIGIAIIVRRIKMR